MKKTILLLSLCLMVCNTATLAQKKSTAGKKPASTQTKSKKTATNNGGKKSASQKTASQSSRPHAFEGVLLYRNYEYYSGMVRALSGGQAYNGERSIRVTLKGNSVHIVDESMHVHTIVLPDADKFYIYSDVSKQGYEADASYMLPKFFSGNAPDVQTSEDEELQKESTLKTSDRMETYKGDRCKVYEGQITIGESYLTDVEMWYSDRLLANKTYRYMFNGLPVPGIVRRGIYSQTGKIPLIGRVKNTTACELVALTEKKIAASEMAPPQDIAIKPFTKATQLYSFYRQSSKALKKAKLYPKKMKTKEINYTLQSQWDFADEWLSKKYGTVSEDLSWARVGESLFSTAAAVSSIGGKKTASTTETLRGIGEIIGGTSTTSDDTDDNISVASRTRGGGGSNSQVKAYERKMDELNKRYNSLTKQYNAIGVQGKAAASAKNAEFAKQVNVKNPTAKKGRTNVQAVRPGQGMGRKVDAAIKTGRQERAAENKASRDREPVAVEIAQVAGEMAQLEQNIYQAKVQANLYGNTEQRMAGASAAVSNFSAWANHLDRLSRASSGSNAQSIATVESQINRMARDMNDEIRRLQGWSEEEISNQRAYNRQKASEGRARQREINDAILQNSAKMDPRSRNNHNTYMKYLVELKAMENGTEAYDKKKAREMQKWMAKEADRYEKSTGEPYPNRDKTWEKWTPGK